MKRKNRKKRQWMAGLLAASFILLMAGCDAPGSGTKGSSSGDAGGGDAGGGADNAAAKGRYIETEIDTPEKFGGSGTFRRLADGTLMLVDTENGTKSVSSDEGKTWKTDPVKELQKLLNGEESEITSVSVAADGGIFFSYILWGKKDKEKNYPEKYVYLKPGGAADEFELGIEKYHASLTGSVFTADGRLFASTNSSNVYEIDYKKKSCKEIFSIESQEPSLCFNENSLIVTDGKKVCFYDLESGKMKADDGVLNDYVQKQEEKHYGTVICGAKNGTDAQTLYVAGCEGIAGHAVGGNVMEQLADGALTNLGDPSKTPREILQNEDGSFLILFRDGELDSYVYDAEAPAVPEHQVTIFGLHDNESVRQAISLFRKKNQEVFVKFEVGVTGEDGVTESDAIKNLNTQLLADEGPDLILLDGMPMDSYIQKGMLADLNDLVTELEGAGGFFSSIMKSYEKEGKICAVPFRYQLPLLMGDRSTLSGISDLKTLADVAEKLAGQPDTEETVLGTYSAKELLEKLYLTSSGAWITAEKTADREKLTDFLSQAKRIYEADQKNLDDSEKKIHEQMINSYKKYYKDEQKVAQQMQSAAQVLEQLRGTQVLTAGYLSSMMEFQQVTSVGKQKGNSVYQAWNGQVQNGFCPTGTIGIASNSKNMDLAKEFIRVMVGTDVQAKDLGDGFPVNADAFKEFVKNPSPGSSMGVGGEDKHGNSFSLDMTWPEKKEIEALQNIIGSLKTPLTAESTIMNEVISIGEKALTGEKGVEDSAEEIVQKISLHLQE